MRTTFNFTNAVLDLGITFSRALNTATRVNSAGLIEAVSADVARFDYDPVTLACKGLLVEENRTNLALNSETFSGRSGIFAGIASSSVFSPGGASYMVKLYENNSNNYHAITAAYTLTSGSQYTMSVFAKKGERNYLQMFCGFNQISGNPYANFDLVNGTATGGGIIKDMGNGIYRCSWTFTAATTSIVVYYGLLDTYSGYRAYPYQGDGSSGLYIWGDQLEAGAFPTSYIPTTTTALTRNADVATITSANFSSFWQVGKGGALVRAIPSTVSGTRPLIQFDDTTADNIIALRGNTTNPELYIKAGGADQATLDAGTIAANTAYRLAGTWATDNCAANLNGGVPVLDTSATIPVVTQARLGSDGTNYLNGHLQSIEYYDERILNSGLQVVSSPAGSRSIIGPVLRDSIIT